MMEDAVAIELSVQSSENMGVWKVKMHMHTQTHWHPHTAYIPTMLELKKGFSGLNLVQYGFAMFQLFSTQTKSTFKI